MTWGLRPRYTVRTPQSRDAALARIDNLMMDKETLAQLFGCATNVIDGWIKAGMPCAVRGSPGTKYQFNTADVLRWVREQERRMGNTPQQHVHQNHAAQAPPQARDRAADATAELKELELAEKRRLVLPRDTMLQQVQEEYTELRSRLSQIAGRVAAKVAACGDPAECERLVGAEVDEAMADLSADLPAARWAEAA